MAVLMIRNLDDEVYQQLKNRARRHQRSTKAEACILLRNGVWQYHKAAVRRIDEIRESLEGRLTGDSTARIREERA